MDMTRAAIFAKVVDAQGFSAAGRLLGMPKTTVSKKVGDLEAELGVRLLNRTTRRVSLTEAGARVYAHCVAAIGHMEQAEREARALQSDPAGMLTVAAPGAIGVPFLLPAIAAFMERYPAVQITLLSLNALADLDRDGIDVMIWAGASMPAGHAVRLVAQVDIGLYASAAYVEQHGAPSTPAELARHRVVALTQSMTANRFIWDLKRGEARVQVAPSIQPRFRSNDPMAVLSAIAAGQGVGGLPVRLVEQRPDGALLTPILPEWSATGVELSALFRDASSLKARLFLDFVVSWFRRL